MCVRQNGLLVAAFVCISPTDQQQNSKSYNSHLPLNCRCQTAALQGMLHFLTVLVSVEKAFLFHSDAYNLGWYDLSQSRTPKDSNSGQVKWTGCACSQVFLNSEMMLLPYFAIQPVLYLSLS